jgi:ElaA protein
VARRAAALGVQGRGRNAADGSVEVVLDAQTPLAGWYQRFGFEVAGSEFVEDGISHLPMRRSRREHQQSG